MFKFFKRKCKNAENIKIIPGLSISILNGPQNHAINFLKFILNNYITKLFDIKNANYIPKPSIISLKSFIKKFDIKAEKLFLKIFQKNLINPKIAGFQTVLIKSSSHPDSNTDLLEAYKKHFKVYRSCNIYY